MTKEFVPYQESLDMKELGFDEPCINQYDKTTHELMYKPPTGILMVKIDNHNKTNHCSAPLYQQAFRWFREKYDLIYVIVKAESWFFTINGCNTQEGFKTYEEAELACIKKLIEIVKNKQQ